MSRRVTGRRVAVVLALVVAAAWVAIFLASSRRAPVAPPTVPNPNGYDDVLKAAREVEAAGFDPKTADVRDVETLRAAVAPVRDALARARVGLGRPFQVPVQYDLNDVYGRLLPEVNLVRRRLASALVAEGTLAELDARPGDAVTAYLDVIRLGVALSRGVNMISHGIGLAVQAQGLAKLRDYRGSLDAVPCRTAIASLETLGGSIESAEEASRHEFLFMDANVRNMPVTARAMFSLTGQVRKEKARAAAQYAKGVRGSELRFRLLLADLAVRLEVLEHGKPPATLDALVPGILKSVPIDPYGTGKPLVYRVTPGGYQLYSLGPDGDDDRLDPPLGKRHTPTSNGDFTIDSF